MADRGLLSLHFSAVCSLLFSSALSSPAAVLSSHAQTVSPGSEPRVSRIVWSYWDNHSSLPKSARLAKASWEHFAPDFEILFLSADTWQEYADQDELVGRSRLQDPKKFSDWLRLSVLSRHGGVWLDATMMLTGPLVHLINESADVSGVELYNNIEPYFLVAPKGSPLMQRWHASFLELMAMSEAEYYVHLRKMRARGMLPLNSENYSDCLSNCTRSQFFKRIVGLGNDILLSAHFGTPVWYIYECGLCNYWEMYLAVMVALNAVMKANGTSVHELHRQHHIATQDAMKTVAAASYVTDWNGTATAHYLMSAESASMDMIEMRGLKLRQGEREAVEKWQHCETGSIICRLQDAVGHTFFEAREPPVVSVAGIPAPVQAQANTANLKVASRVGHASVRGGYFCEHWSTYGNACDLLADWLSVPSTIVLLGPSCTAVSLFILGRRVPRVTRWQKRWATFSRDY